MMPAAKLADKLAKLAQADKLAGLAQAGQNKGLQLLTPPEFHALIPEFWDDEFLQKLDKTQPEMLAAAVQDPTKIPIKIPDFKNGVSQTVFLREPHMWPALTVRSVD
jgi:hypothetical protein